MSKTAWYIDNLQALLNRVLVCGTSTHQVSGDIGIQPTRRVAVPAAENHRGALWPPPSPPVVSTTVAPHFFALTLRRVWILWLVCFKYISAVFHSIIVSGSLVDLISFSYYLNMFALFISLIYAAAIILADAEVTPPSPKLPKMCRVGH